MYNSVLGPVQIRELPYGPSNIQKKFMPQAKAGTSFVCFCYEINRLVRTSEQNPQENVQLPLLDRRKNTEPWSGGT